MLEGAGEASGAACLLEVEHAELAEAAAEGKERELVPWRSCRQCRSCSHRCKHKSLMQRFGGGRGGKASSSEEREGRKEWGLAELAVFQMLSKHNSGNNCSKKPKECVSEIFVQNLQTVPFSENCHLSRRSVPIAETSGFSTAIGKFLYSQKVCSTEYQYKILGSGKLRTYC